MLKFHLSLSRGDLNELQKLKGDYNGKKQPCYLKITLSAENTHTYILLERL